MSKSFNPDDMSPIEASLYKQLRAAQKKFNIEGLEYEAERLTYTIEADYVPDFVVRFEDGRTMYLEAKGWLRPEDKKKMLLVKAQHPDLDIRFIFEKNNKFSRSQVRYGDWAGKKGFPWAVGQVPEEWLK